MVELVLRAVISLAFVVGLLWAITRIGSRRLRGSAHSLVRVMTRQPLGRGSSLAVVNVGGRVLVVGMTEHQVRLLAELDPAEVESALEVEAEVQTGVDSGPRPALPVPTSAVSGSVLSGQTWKQAFTAASKRVGNTG